MVSEFCKDHLADTLKKSPAFQSKNYQLALRETFFKLDSILYSQEGADLLKSQYEAEATEANYKGCTAIVVLITKDKYFVANAGDSRCYLSTKKKMVVPLSQDHKPELPKELERIKNANGFVVDGRICGNLNLSRSIGDLQYKQNKILKPEEQIISCEPDILDKNITNDDHFLLMGCDGVWETMGENDICVFIRERLE